MQLSPDTESAHMEIERLASRYSPWDLAQYSKELKIEPSMKLNLINGFMLQIYLKVTA